MIKIEEEYNFTTINRKIMESNSIIEKKYRKIF